MPFLALPPIGTMTLNVSNFISAHPSLINDIAGHALQHALYSYMRGRRRPGLSRRQMRKTANMKHRWFVDNIIMHHRRLHAKNRELIVNQTRDRMLAKKNQIKKESLPLNPVLRREAEQKTRWQDMAKIKERSNTLRGRVDARKLRARSRWLSIAENVN